MHHHTHTTHHASVIAAAFSRFLPARRLVLALLFLFTLLPALPTSASAAGQFTSLTIGATTYDATKDQFGPGWSWTASTNTLEFPTRSSFNNGDDDILYRLINGNIALGTSNPAAVATIEVDGEVFINGNISCQGTLLVNIIGYWSHFKVNGNLAGSLSITGDLSLYNPARVSISNNIDGNLLVNSGTVKVGGKVGGNLTVSGGVVTINGMIGGARNITGGTVKVNGSFIAGAPPAITTNVTIPLNTLTLGSYDMGTGWWFANGTTLVIDGSSINYTLTGTASPGIGVIVENTVNGSLTLDGVTITAPVGSTYNALSLSGNNLSVYIKNNNTLNGTACGIASGVDGVLTLDAAAGATLTAIGGEQEGIYCDRCDLALQGSGTFNFCGGNIEQYNPNNPEIGNAIKLGGDLLLQDSVAVNATAGDNTSSTDDDFYIDKTTELNHGIMCFGDITIADNAKLNATGGSVFGAGCRAGNGILTLSKLTVTSAAANALVVAGGVGAIVDSWHGSGIAALFDLQLAGAGSINAIGDNALASVYDIAIDGCKITAEASDSAGYALHAGGYNSTTYTYTGGTVFITGGTTIASNIKTSGNIYFRTLSHTGGILNGDGPDNPNPPTPPNPDHGGGGGGAPSLPGLALMAAMLAVRALKKKSRAG